MVIGLTLLGMFLGVVFAFESDTWLGLGAGGAIGFLFARLLKLQKALKQLRTDHELLRRSSAFRQEAQAEFSPADSSPGEQPEVSAGPPEWAAPQPAATPTEAPTANPTVATESPGTLEPARPSGPSVISQLAGRIGGWFTTGNVPVKLGVLLSFIGVAFFLKYAIDNELLTLPIEFRLLGVATAGLVMLVIGWRLRQRLRVYALSLQGGGIGILFLTIFAAFRIWNLLPAGLAFALLTTLAAATGALSVLQKARWLIILGATGGFLAPVLTSTGQGSHVALFSYYLVLNAAILGVAWFQSWRAVNLVGFVFTFVIGSMWGYRFYRPDLFASTEPFLVAHFLLYNAIAILHAIRQPREKVGLVDGGLVFGTPVISFALQAAMVYRWEYGMAISAAVLAVFYVLTAWWLRRSHGAGVKVLSDAYIALAVAFATITIPLALDARWTAAAWALEGAALIWVATRQKQHLANLAGAALIVFSGFAFMIHGWRSGAGWPVLNGNVMSGVMLSFSALFGAYRLRDFSLAPLSGLYRWIAWGLFAWGTMWWLATGLEEIDDRLGRNVEYHAGLLFIAATAAGFAWLGRVRDWGMARKLTLLYLPTLAWCMLAYADYFSHFLIGPGWLAWPVALAVQVHLLRQMDARGSQFALASHLVLGALLATMLGVELLWQVRAQVSGAWGVAAASTAPAIVAMLAWRFRSKPEWPVPQHPVGYRALTLVLVTAQLVFLAAVTFALPGSPGTLPYIPVLNPFDLAVLFAALAGWLSLRIASVDDLFQQPPMVRWLPAYRWVLAGALLLLTTIAILRGVHHIDGVAWRTESLLRSVTAQTALSIYWGLLGFVGMIWGARKAQRGIWLVGAALMGLVVIKLFLVDLGNSGTIERIISFIGVGALLLVVGYFAPVPPRQQEEKA